MKILSVFAASCVLFGLFLALDWSDDVSPGYGLILPVWHWIAGAMIVICGCLFALLAFQRLSVGRTETRGFGMLLVAVGLVASGVLIIFRRTFYLPSDIATPHNLQFMRILVAAQLIFFGFVIQRARDRITGGSK